MNHPFVHAAQATAHQSLSYWEDSPTCAQVSLALLKQPRSAGVATTAIWTGQRGALTCFF